MPTGLVFQFAEYFGKRRISDVFRKAMILHHPGNVQSFNKDRLVLADDLRREFLNRVSARITYLRVKLSYFEFGFLSIIAALDLAGKTALNLLQPFFSSNQWMRVFKSVSVAGCSESLNADVNSDLGFGLFQWLHVRLDQSADKVTFALVFADCQVDELCIIGKWTRPGDIQRIILLGECDLAILVRESVLRVTNRLRAVFRFELRVIGSLLEEIRERRI